MGGGMLDLLSGVPLLGLDPDALAVACSRVRRICGWHIAPQVTETLTLSWSSAGYYVLPSLQVVSVDSVTNGTSPTVAFDWSPSGSLWVSPVSICPSRVGRPRRLTVTITHGYDECPDDVRDVVAQMARGVGERRVRSQTVGPYAATYVEDEYASDLEGYRLPILA